MCHSELFDPVTELLKVRITFHQLSGFHQLFMMWKIFQLQKGLNRQEIHGHKGIPDPSRTAARTATTSHWDADFFEDKWLEPKKAQLC